MNSLPLSIPNFDTARVLVVGDVMLDRYWYGATSRISPEAPVPVVHVQDVEERPGGAGNVAVNIVSLGATAVLVGVVGEDDLADALIRLLHGHGVEPRLQRRAGRKTVGKLRVVSRHQQLIRLDFEDPMAGGAIALDDMELAALLVEVGAVVLSDYGKGALTEVRGLIAAARSLNLPVVVDPKGADFSRYRGATVITPNLAEFEAVVGRCEDLDVLVERAETLRGTLDLQALLVTRSEHGMTLVREGLPALHLPAHAREVFDVTGAGDTVVGVLAGVLAAGLDLGQGTALANLAAGLVVGKLGTASVTVPELRGALHEQTPGGSGVMDEDLLLEAVAAARQRRERLVMTNGCFDILHAGHVRYLMQARGLGDRLIVAVNDDASVKRLKGHDRPINPLARRMAVLDALACVDYVVPFAEDTPERLICRVVPDVLVKGGDYRPEDIAGGDCVRAGGGRVAVLAFEDGISTSGIIEAINRSAVRREQGVESQ